MSQGKFGVFLSPDGKLPYTCISERFYARACDAYPSAVAAWQKEPSFIELGKVYRRQPYVKVMRVGATRAVHSLHGGTFEAVTLVGKTHWERVRK